MKLDQEEIHILNETMQGGFDSFNCNSFWEKTDLPMFDEQVQRLHSAETSTCKDEETRRVYSEIATTILKKTGMASVTELFEKFKELTDNKSTACHKRRKLLTDKESTVCHKRRKSN